MDDLFKIYINFPVPAFSYLPFITLLPIPPDSYRDKAEERLLKVCASVADKKYFCCNFITVLRGIEQGYNSKSILTINIIALYAAVCG
jgi:hypothetical protein